MTENDDRWSASALFYAPLVIALCSTVGETAAHEQLLFLIRLQPLPSLVRPYWPNDWPGPHDNNWPVPHNNNWPVPHDNNWPGPYFPPGHPFAPAARVSFDDLRRRVHPPADRPPSHQLQFGPPRRHSPDFHRPRPTTHYDSPLRPHAVKTLRLNEGDYCRRGHGLFPDYRCVNAKNCAEPLARSVREDNRLDVCSFDGPEPIVCCPTSTGEPRFPHVVIRISKRPLAEPPSAAAVRPPFETEAAGARDVDRVSSAAPAADLIEPPSVEEITVAADNAPYDRVESSTAATDRRPGALSASDRRFPTDGTVQQETTSKTTSPKRVSVQSPSNGKVPMGSTPGAAVSDHDKLIPSDAALERLTEDVSATAADPTDAGGQRRAEKIFSGPGTVGPPHGGTVLDPGSDVTMSPLDRPAAVDVVQPSTIIIEETAATGPDAGSQVGSSRNTNAATEKCRQYSMAIANSEDVDTQDKTTNGADPARLYYHYPHMAIIGYGKTVDDENEWKCGGSLISERWILTAAHCYKIGSLARWARLGVEYNPSVVDIRSSGNGARTKDYRIVQHVLHPGFRKSGRYNDIALFSLEKDVEFSTYARPICLNSDPLTSPSTPLTASWGRTSTGERRSDVLLETRLETVPGNQCERSYSTISDPKVRFGVRSDSMICAASSRSDDGDTCSGVPGGPLQEENVKNPDSYTLFGVTSFCGSRDYPGVYTRVSKYIRWIEEVVWSTDD